ncbi:phosphotransferase [Diaporthe eres]|uniref:Phosphotransferase enzyme family protein n=1 Tax=Diaporthe vaccinii TaxID=105482 RepID=A0ABR4EL57_9PEZI|nr:phosphotransferase [Diaporthe eres]
MKNETRHKDRELFIDSIVENRNEELADEWFKFANNWDNQAKLVNFVRTYRPGFSLPKNIYNGIRGNYNVNWLLRFEDGFSTMIHAPIPHAVAFPDEKIRVEAAALMLIRDNTTIPVPEVYAWCISADSPTGYGPLIVMEYIEHAQSLENIIRDQIKTAGSSSPKKDLTDSTLLKEYRQMANIMIQPSTIEG